jgi:hypothetical protein
MIELPPQSQGNVVGLRATGTLTDADYRDTLIPRLNAALARHGRVNIVLFLDEGFEGWDLRAAWDDLSYGLAHRADFGRLALVGGPAWVAAAMKSMAFLIKGEVRTFPRAQLTDAWSWAKG